MSSAAPLGILELTDRGAGFLRRRQFSYLPGDGDLYVPARLVSQYGLRVGDELSGEAGRSPGRGKAPPLERLTLLNGRAPESLRTRPAFASLGAIHPDEQLR
ncbi:MAG TPA: hypothetical protein VNH46_01805, partial [Gemmatimonadales bacterium]|nr:hypothetical protein [Gemmatimonadales bacterium]